MTAGKNILVRFKRRWQLLLWLKIFLYALGPALLFYVFLGLFWSLAVFFATMVLLTFTFRPWKINLEKVSRFIDAELATAEYSSSLLLTTGEELSGLGRIQQQKVSRQLEGAGKIQPPVRMARAGILTAVMLIASYTVHNYGLVERFVTELGPSKGREQVVFVKEDSTSIETTPPEIEHQRVTIDYPDYTNLPSTTTSKMAVKAVKGSRLTWHLKFDAEVDSVAMELMGEKSPMKPNDGGYLGTAEVSTSGFYNFRFQDSLGSFYVSELYSIEMTEDEKPVVEVQDLEQFSSFEFNDEKEISFTSNISDDFGISEAAIIATVSRGSGESVKFREEQLGFDNELPIGSKNTQLVKKIDLDDLEMAPGDELYFYVEVRDTKPLKPNVSRSETFFAVIKDTLSDDFGVEGGLGVDLMPDYFRSQRQLIIDTEKLIKDKPGLPKEEFNARSNELAADQKALRLKYGQFMGDETENNEAEMQHEPSQAGADQEDPLAAYSHAHDSENEHNLVAEDHEDHEGEETEDPLKEYLHNHEDPEESTLFTESLKAKLRRALNTMWDSELHLRLYEPEKSLPYQYEALELIQEIKNSARIYVHRIGFDPPPIKEDTRLTGDIDEVSHFQKLEELRKEDSFVSIREAVRKLEQMIMKGNKITASDRRLMEEAGTELASIAIEEPGRYLETLQLLKRLAGEEKPSEGILLQAQRGLLQALPSSKANISGNADFNGDLNELLLKELERND